MRETEKKEWIESNMGLVGKVIKTEIGNIGKLGGLTYDDLFQVGCIGLCKAVDKLGKIKCSPSTYAYACIKNAIFKELNRSTQYSSHETLSEDGEIYAVNEIAAEPVSLVALLEEIKTRVAPSTARGIDALILHSRGYSYREIGEKWSVTASNVTAMVSRARACLSKTPEIMELWQKAV